MTKPTNKGEGRRPKRRRYNAEFKAEAVRLLREREADGANMSEVARELGISPGVLWHWAQRPADAPANQSGGRRASGETLEQEVRRLRRENAILKQEREFAKKAAAFFARESP